MQKQKVSYVERLEHALVKIIQQPGADQNQPGGVRVLLAFLNVLSKVFQFVVSWSVKYSVIYGSLATLLFFFMFLSYLWKIIFAAVIVSYVHQTQTTGIEYEL